MNEQIDDMDAFMKWMTSGAKVCEPKDTCEEYGHTLNISFRGLLAQLKGEIWYKDAEAFGYYLLSFRFSTLCALEAVPIRLSITRAYTPDIDLTWACGDIIQHALCHEAAEGAPHLLLPPIHKPGLLDDHDVASCSAEMALESFKKDQGESPVDNGNERHAVVTRYEAWGRGW